MEKTAVSESAPRSASYEDILVLSEHLVGEILNGALYTHT